VEKEVNKGLINSLARGQAVEMQACLLVTAGREECQADDFRTMNESTEREGPTKPRKRMQDHCET
jgi:hypothetical protein